MLIVSFHRSIALSWPLHEEYAGASWRLMEAARGPIKQMGRPSFSRIAPNYHRLPMKLPSLKQRLARIYPSLHEQGAPEWGISLPVPVHAHCSRCRAKHGL